MRATPSLTIPIIEPENQVPVLETDVLDYVEDTFGHDEIREQLHTRLQAGAAKYGTAWNEVNLTQDLVEELLDAMNYVVMSLVRMEAVLTGTTQGHRDFLKYDRTLQAIATYLEAAFHMAEDLPQMEGPSSKDWLPLNKIDPSEAQARFQEVVNEN